VEIREISTDRLVCNNRSVLGRIETVYIKHVYPPWNLVEIYLWKQESRYNLEV
jgi:hypothetical protein